MDPVLSVLLGLLATSLLAFFTGLIPYPYGLIMLLDVSEFLNLPRDLRG